MSSSSASTWVSFFSNAGIPSPTNASYAHIFVKNKIAMDMLTELNKEYLREMGITPMGDIISILRHSKTVTDQSVRDKILAENKPVRIIAKINPATKISTRISSSNVASLSVAPRRVLPEHEGKYKVSLPKGSTKKSREILAKHSAMQSDKMEKKSIFDRLKSKDDDSPSNESQSRTKISNSSASIFNRLGSYEGLEKKIDRSSIAFSGILKNKPAQMVPKGVVKLRPQQRIHPKSVVRHMTVPDSSCDSDDDDKMDSDELKQVSFSPEVQVRVFSERPAIVANPKNIKLLKSNGVKSRLGKSTHQPATSPRSLHTVKKISMKPTATSQMSKMKSDNMSLQAMNVHSRLDINNRKSTNHLASKIKNFKIDMKDSKPISSSVFNRLGRNK